MTAYICLGLARTSGENITNTILFLRIKMLKILNDVRIRITAKGQIGLVRP